jgi:hypothetical protein
MCQVHVHVFVYRNICVCVYTYKYVCVNIYKYICTVNWVQLGWLRGEVDILRGQVPIPLVTCLPPVGRLGLARYQQSHSPLSA